MRETSREHRLLEANGLSWPFRLTVRTSSSEPYAPRPESLSWPISAAIITLAGTFLVSHVVGHDPRFIRGMYR
jgi:hypothetical protein